jgi:uroporphyrin-III C-methyltransferase
MKITILCSKKALKIFVGKRKGSHEYTKINQLIVDNALTTYGCGSVKGGDPFILVRRNRVRREFGIPLVPVFLHRLRFPARYFVNKEAFQKVLGDYGPLRQENCQQMLL